MLFFKSPVRELSSHILTLLSLLPGVLEGGLDEAACLVPEDTPSPSPRPSPLTSPSPPPPRASTPPPLASPPDDPSPTSSVHSYIPNSDSINNLSSKVAPAPQTVQVKDRALGALGYISGRSSVEDLALPEAAETTPAPDFPKVQGAGCRSAGCIGAGYRVPGDVCRV